MKNFVFISPNFPDNYWNFCRRLRENGLRVLGVGDCPYDNLTPELKGSLDEYYKVDSLENYDSVYRAVAFFIHKYGRVDWLESNNEYWLERDAQLREDFNISTGFRPADMPFVKCKSLMKQRYALAGIPTARYHMVDDFDGCAAFIREVGWPVIVTSRIATSRHPAKNTTRGRVFVIGCMRSYFQPFQSASAFSRMWNFPLQSIVPPPVMAMRSASSAKMKAALRWRGRLSRIVCPSGKSGKSRMSGDARSLAVRPRWSSTPLLSAIAPERNVPSSITTRPPPLPAHASIADCMATVSLVSPSPFAP